jgi:hypothetical protein
VTATLAVDVVPLGAVPALEIDSTASDPPSLFSQSSSTVYGMLYATVPVGVPFQIVARASGYLPETLQEMIATRQATTVPELPLVTSSYATSLTNAAPGYDPSLGLLGLSVRSLGRCADTSGATLEITGPDAGSSRVIYLANGTPSSATSVTGAAEPSAFAYNVPVGVDVSVTVSHPTCAPAPYPVTSGTNVTLTGKVRVSPGNAASFALVYLQ